jgi:hypothetical protein
MHACSQKHFYSIKPAIQQRSQNNLNHLAEVRCIKEETHQNTAESAGNRNGHNPGSNKQTNTLPVDSLVGAVAETNADGSTSDAHRGRDGERVLREDEHRDGGAHFHAAAARRRVVRDLVAHDCEWLLVRAWIPSGCCERAYPS